MAIAPSPYNAFRAENVRMAEGKGTDYIVASVIALGGLVLVGLGAYTMLQDSELRPYRDVPGGDVKRGRAAIEKYQCGTCHKIAGIPGANGTRGQSLSGLALRNDIVGALPNTPEDVANWIQNPKATYPQTVMPNLNVTKQDAIDIVAYLYCLPP